MPKVFVLKDSVKRAIRHPLFPHSRFSDAGEAEWPLDQFTIRCIRDGDISLRPAGETETRDYGD